MKSHELIPSESFGLCFSLTGGIMMLGGVDAAVHREPMQFVPLSKAGGGWFTVHLFDIRMSRGDGSNEGSIEVKDTLYNTGKGVIVDSGTTDTYLPRTVAGQFKQQFKKFAKRDYGNVMMTLSDAEFAALPTVIFVFHDAAGAEVCPFFV
jgi:hypothetical protein